MGEASRVCLVSGEWSGQDPVCRGGCHVRTCVCTCTTIYKSCMTNISVMPLTTDRFVMHDLYSCMAHCEDHPNNVRVEALNKLPN